MILAMHGAIVSTTTGKERQNTSPPNLEDYSEVWFKQMSRRKGQCGGKQGSEVYGGLAAVRCPLQGVLR